MLLFRLRLLVERIHPLPIPPHEQRAHPGRARLGSRAAHRALLRAIGEERGDLIEACDVELIDGVALHDTGGAADEGDDLRLGGEPGGADLDVIFGEEVLEEFPIALLPRDPRLAFGRDERLLERIGGRARGVRRVRGVRAREGRGRDRGSRGEDSTDNMKRQMLTEILERIEPGWKHATPDEQEKLYLNRKRELGNTRLMNLTEFTRAVHAEMEALLSAARVGVSVRGATLYTTTFPCHNCAKHIVDSGIARVVFIEPIQRASRLSFTTTRSRRRARKPAGP